MVLRRVGSACAHNKDSSLATWGMTHVPIGNFVTKPYSLLHRVVTQNSGSQLLLSSPGVSLVIGKRKKLGSRGLTTYWPPPSGHSVWLVVGRGFSWSVACSGGRRTEVVSP